MKTRYLAWLLPLLFCCCHKNSNNNQTVKTTAFTFTTTCDSVITAYVNTTADIAFEVNVLTGNLTGNTLTYTITGLPAGVADSPTSITVNGTLGGLFVLNVGNAAAGSYTINLVSNCAATGTISTPLTLKILALPDYSTLLPGTYPNSHDYCTPTDTLYTFSSTISTIPGTPNAVKIANVRVYDTSLTFTASVSGTVAVPFQTIGTYATWGTGNYTHDTGVYDTLYALTIYDTTVHGHDTEACLIHIQH